MRREILRIGLCIGFLLLLMGQGASQGVERSSSPAAPNSVGTAFAYQGSLANSLGPVTGNCDLRLTLYGQASGGAAVAGPVTLNRISVQNGLFSVQVDFGPGAFTGDSRWLEAAVRCPAGQGTFTTLTPRQPITPVPYALYAVDARQSLGDFTVQDELWVDKTAILGGPDVIAGLSLRAPDVYLNADPSYQRGKGGRALVHDFGNTLALNYANDFAGGVRIGGNTTITGQLTVEGKTLRLLGWDLYMNAGADRGDGGRALVHGSEDRLVVNFESDFAGGVDIDSSTRILGELGVFGPSLQLYGPDFYINGGTDRGNGGRALVHGPGDQLVLNFEGDFAGGVTVHSNLSVDGVLTSTQTLLGRDVHITGDNLTFTDHTQPGGILWLNRSAAVGYANAPGAWSTDAQEGDLVLRAHDGARILLARGQSTPDHPAALTVEPSGLVRIPNLQTGGLVEANLQTSEERNAPAIVRFEQGDVLCWNPTEKVLQHCMQEASPLVVAVANGDGKPMIAGVEPIKVRGPVRPGDLLVSSSTPGVAVAWRTLSHDPTPSGVVIAKALEANEAGEGLIQALITLR